MMLRRHKSACSVAACNLYFEYVAPQHRRRQSFVFLNPTCVSVKDAQELLALQTSLLQPVAEKAAAYGRQLHDIVAGVNAEVTKVGEAALAKTQKSVASFVDAATKNAPAGSETAVSLMKSAVAAANSAYEGLNKAAKQAAEVADANFTTITNNTVKATQTAAKASKKSA